MGLATCKVIDLPRFTDARGSLSFLEGEKHVPFSISRIYYLYDVPPDAERGAHAHKDLEQLIIAISGSFDVILDDGSGKRRFSLSRPDRGLYVCPMIWRDLVDFSPGAVCLVLASKPYDEKDYFRDYEEFHLAAGKSRSREP